MKLNPAVGGIRIWPILLVVAILLAAVAAHGAGVISAGEVRRWQENKNRFYLIDVRPGQLFSRKHIEGALGIPAFVVHRKGLPTDEPIVLYDGGIGSLEALGAADKLAGAGYHKVYILEGGLARWEASALPLQAQMGVVDDLLVESLSCSELIQARRDGVAMLLVDLREAALFAAGSIPGAKNAEPAALAGLTASWPKDGLIVLFAGVDRTAQQQAELLRRAGFTMIRFLYGGYPEWKRQNAS